MHSKERQDEQQSETPLTESGTEAKYYWNRIILRNLNTEWQFRHIFLLQELCDATLVDFLEPKNVFVTTLSKLVTICSLNWNNLLKWNRMFQKIVECFQWLHNRNMIHRDKTNDPSVQSVIPYYGSTKIIVSQTREYLSQRWRSSKKSTQFREILFVFQKCHKNVDFYT